MSNYFAGKVEPGSEDGTLSQQTRHCIALKEDTEGQLELHWKSVLGTVTSPKGNESSLEAGEVMGSQALKEAVSKT